MTTQPVPPGSTPDERRTAPVRFRSTPAPTRSRPRTGWRTATVALAAAATGLTGAVVAAPAVAAPNSDVGYPVFSGSATPVPDEGTGYDTRNQLQAIFDADVAAGAGSSVDSDFWIDEMLARTGNTPGGGNGDANQWLFSRGKAVFMKTHQPGVIGFGGEVAYWETIAGGQGAFQVTAQVDGADVVFTEVPAERKQTPSYWRAVFTNAQTGLRIVETKFITGEDVATARLDVSSTTGQARTVVLTAASSFATQGEAGADELTGAVVANNNLTTIFPRLSGDGFTVADGSLTTTLAVPATGAATTKVQIGFATNERPETLAQYEEVRAATPAAAYTTHVTDYNRWWADNVPYLDTPEDNIDKTLFYRWWLMRFNYLDANIPGNDYQFPTSMEGVLGYNNAIVLTTGMFIDDLKYFRDPVYSYGPWVAAGETSKSYKYVDNPGDPANWSNSYTQYISEAAWRSYQLHGGPTAIAENLAEYAEDDVKGLQDAYDADGNGLIEYNWGAMTGNDADAVSFHWRPGNMDRTENAYLYSNARASAEAYRVAGNTAKADEMDAFAQSIKDAVLEYLWEPERTTPDEVGLMGNMLKHRHVATDALVPWKESNNYYPFTVGLMPKPGEADYDQPYVEALRLWADDEQYPIFPFFTANQADQAAYGGPGSNNFSIINSTVTFRMLSSVLRDYPNEYVDAEWYKKLLYWNAWSHYQNNGDNRFPDQNEFWSNGSHDPQNIGYRSWIHHTILGTTNFTMIEDAMGLRPRSDAKIELDPIDVDWDHFTVNNVRYRDRDLTVTWDAPGGERHYGDDVPEGYSVFLDGELAFTVDGLGKVVYDPATGTVETEDGIALVGTAATTTLDAPQDVTFDADARVVDVMAKAGADVDPASAGSANVAQGKAAAATFSAATRDPAGAVDGTTINEPFWGTAGSPNASDSLTIDLGGATTVDDVRVYFYRSSSTATVQGYAAPSQFLVEYDDGSGFKPVPDSSRAPVYPQGNLNHVRFSPVEATQLRVTVQHAPGFRTGIKEVQAFDTGVPAPASSNQAPLADAWLDSAYNQAGSARLVGTAKDDGLPGTGVTSAWSVVDAPDGGSVVFDAATAPTTVARFTEPGRYTLRLTVSDGELTSVKDLVVQGTTQAEGSINVASTATASAEYTAGWNAVAAVNDGKPPFFTGGAGTELWGTWSGSRPATRWLQYDFPAAVRVSSSSIDFWSDVTAGGDGVAVPESWKIQYWDAAGAGSWKDVTGASAYPTQRGATNTVTFDGVTTTKLRATLNALPNAARTSFSAVGVSEWRVFAAPASAVEDVDVRTEVGVVPTLPATVAVTYADGSTAQASVAWGAIEPSQVAAIGDFTVSGFVAGTTLTTTAHVWVRGTDAVQINTVDPVDVRTTAGVAPALPPTVTVQYNDGSRSSGIAVTWAQVDPASYAEPGTFEVSGTVAGTDKLAVATVVVGDGGTGGEDTVAPLVAITPDPAPTSGWADDDVTVTVTATDAVDDAPAIEVAVGDADLAAYTGPVTITNEGQHEVRARATDEAGNVSDVASLTVSIDRTVPTVTATPDTERRTVTVTGQDALSGIAAVQYRLEVAGQPVPTDWTTYAAPVAVGSAATTVHARALDRAGNVSAEQAVAFEAGTASSNIALQAVATASVTAGWVTPSNLNDGVAPTGPVGPNSDVWTTWPEVGEQWIRYDWTVPVTVDRTRLWFTSDLDATGAGVAPPASWTLQYWVAGEEEGTGEWRDVTDASAYGTSATDWNTVTFAPVTTTALRAVMQASGTESGKGAHGVQEWEVYDVVATPEPEAPEFTDVPAGTQFEEEIRWLATAGISTGWELPDGSREFRPVTPIARDAMAAFLYRMAGSPDFTAPTTSPFSDVDVSNQFYKEIAWLAEKKISTGWVQADGTAQFRPLEPIARDAMAAFLHRAAGSPAVALPATSPFDDITPSTQFYAEISWMYSEEITTGWQGNDGTRIYRPLSPVNRDAMAAFLYRYHHNLG
ncbi:OmpL47-type beta-barrel domain-containing protein [Serinibacter arcticus]|uniref:Uncharacterized protein n=1 Tax=Serinibacter arcticus TaxID=1655435 RepID=A0A4Z1E4Q4_9MICO|nr:Ig-like domain-containing protein [Serinibacter arcticus]TGO05752.1 hypothetical protein SERN_1756 [Serinibacter arcticus]